MIAVAGWIAFFIVLAIVALAVVGFMTLVRGRSGSGRA